MGVVVGGPNRASAGRSSLIKSGSSRLHDAPVRGLRFPKRSLCRQSDIPRPSSGSIPGLGRSQVSLMLMFSLILKVFLVPGRERPPPSPLIGLRGPKPITCGGDRFTIPIISRHRRRTWSIRKSRFFNPHRFFEGLKILFEGIRNEDAKQSRCRRCAVW